MLSYRRSTQPLAETKQHHVAAETFHKPCLPQSKHGWNYSHDIHIYEDISSASGHSIKVKAVTCVSYSEAERSWFPEGFPMLRSPIQYSLYYTQHLNPSMNSLWYMTYIAYNIHVAAFIMCILTRIQVFVSYEPIFTFVLTYKYAIMECIATTTYATCIMDAILCISDATYQANQDQSVE